MTKPYDQLCPIALALDEVGERWSLLIARELMLGPLRFGEIAAGLPGIGSRQLSERLRSLSDCGIVEPGDGQAYALTGRGRTLAPVLTALAAWGAGLCEGNLSRPSSATSIALMLWARAVRHGSGLRTSVRLDLDAAPFAYLFSDNGVQASRGAPEGAAVRIAVSSACAVDLLIHRRPLVEALRSGAMAIAGEGGREVARALFSPIDD